jgi:hypothetical protein
MKSPTKRSEALTRRSIAIWLLLFAMLLSLVAPASAQDGADGATEPEAPPDPAVVLPAPPEAYPAEEGEPARVEILSEKREGDNLRVVKRIFSNADLYMSSAFPNQNFGRLSTLNLGYQRNGQAAMRIAIRYDVSSIPRNARINRATYGILQQSVNPFPDNAMSFRAFLMTTSWSETNDTWATLNNRGGQSFPLGSVPGNPNTWIQGDITGPIAGWVNGSQPNNGLLIIGDETASSGRWRVFLSRESGSPPFVDVDYTVQCDTLPPVTSFNPLPRFVNDPFQTSWGGQDRAPSGCTPTGINRYDTWYRINGGSWQLWREQTQRTDSEFTRARNNDRVDFRVRANDRAGNWESVPGNAQATTQVDTQPPFASVNGLPQFTPQQSFTVSWSGTDNLSGIRNYDVWWRVPGGGWNVLAQATTQTSILFQNAQNGVTYEFVARATDNVNNQQTPPTAPQAATTISLYPTSNMNPINPGVIKPTSPVTTSVNLSWIGNAVPGTFITEYQVRYQFNTGPWILWQTFNGQTTSAQFVFQQANPNAGDGFYGFAVTARNNLNQQQPFDNNWQASVIVDMADRLQPVAFMPQIRR